MEWEPGWFGEDLFCRNCGYRREYQSPPQQIPKNYESEENEDPSGVIENHIDPWLTREEPVELDSDIPTIATSSIIGSVGPEQPQLSDGPCATKECNPEDD